MDTLSTPTSGQKNGEKIKPQNGEKFWYKSRDNFRTSINKCCLSVCVKRIHALIFQILEETKSFDHNFTNSAKHHSIKAFKDNEHVKFEH